MTQPLSRERIVAEALAVADEKGVSKLSIRTIATRLGVTPMALYKHVSNKDELLALVLDTFVVRADVIPTEELEWDDWVLTVGRRMFDALCSDPSWVALFGSVPIGVEAAKVTEAFVKRLTTAGFSQQQAVRAYFAVIQTVLGAAGLQSSLNAGKSTPDELKSVTKSYLRLPSAASAEVAPDLDQVAQGSQIEIGLPFVIAALRAELIDAP